MIIIDDIEQGTPEWDELRIGNPGASSMSRIITTKGIPSQSADKYLDELFDEVILNRKTKTFSSPRMKEGLLNEDESRKNFEFNSGLEVEQVALCYKDEKKLFHCSPDGIIPELKQGFETKDATPTIQRRRLENHAKGKTSFLMEHFVQVQASLYITGYDSWVLQSYCQHMPTLTLTVVPDFLLHKNLERELYKLIGKLNLMVEQYMRA